MACSGTALLFIVNYWYCKFLDPFLVLLRVVRPTKIYQDTKFNGPKLNGGNFASTSEV
jgi:hypothetical protein